MRKWSCFAQRARRRAAEPSHVSCLSPAPGTPERTPGDPLLIHPQEHSGEARRDTGVLGTGGVDLAHTLSPRVPRQAATLAEMFPALHSLLISCNTSKGVLLFLRYLPHILMAQNTVQTHHALVKPTLMRPDFHCIPDDASRGLAGVLTASETCDAHWEHPLLKRFTLPKPGHLSTPGSSGRSLRPLLVDRMDRYLLIPKVCVPGISPGLVQWGETSRLFGQRKVNMTNS